MSEVSEPFILDGSSYASLLGEVGSKFHNVNNHETPRTVHLGSRTRSRVECLAYAENESCPFKVTI